MKRLDRNAARKLISKIRVNGAVIQWNHCKEALADDNLDTVDLDNVLRCGIIREEPEWNDKSEAWRYRVATNAMLVVIQFESEAELSVVTAWRLKGK